MDLSYREKRSQGAGRGKVAVCVAAVVIAVLVVAAVAAGALLQWAISPASEGGVRAGDAGEAGQVVSQAWPIVQHQSDATVEVVDCAGRAVQVPEDPVSIAVFDSFSGEFAVMVGAGDRVCGMPAGVMSDVLLQRLCPRLGQRAGDATMLSLSGSSINVEAVLAMQCDVAIVKETMTDAECAKLDAVGIPYVKVGYASIAEQMEAMEVVGSACGAQAAEKAAAYVDYYDGVVQDVRLRSALVPDGARKRVYHAINAPLLTDSSGSLGADWIMTTGCFDAASASAPTTGTDYQATVEQVYQWAPDVIVANAASTAETIRTDALWAGLGAVRDGQVYAIPVGATRWGQRGSVETYMAMLWLGCTVYPEQYADVDLRQVVADYYRDFMGIDVTDELWSQMLAGELRVETGNGGDGTGGRNG